jgi:hypothetical protein
VQPPDQSQLIVFVIAIAAPEPKKSEHFVTLLAFLVQYLLRTWQTGDGHVDGHGLRMTPFEWALPARFSGCSPPDDLLGEVLVDEFEVVWLVRMRVSMGNERKKGKRRE